MQGILDLQVHPLHHPITLRVVGSGEDVLDPQPCACADVNWMPLSVVTAVSTPKHAIQLKSVHPTSSVQTGSCENLFKQKKPFLQLPTSIAFYILNI
jgi:hypothetical protein